MSFYNVINPSSMVAGAPEDVSQVVANFNAIAAVVNGNIDNSNVNASAAIDQTKLALPFMGRNLGWSKGSLPPASPSDGDIWLLPADATNGVMWMFRYNAGSASAYKWEFIGGPPQRSEITPTESVNTTANIWTDAPTIGPSVVVARAGEYWVRYGLGWYATLSSATVLTAGVSIGGAAPIPPNLLQYNFAVGGQYLGIPSSASLRTFAAGNTVKMIYQTSITAVPAMSIFYRWLELTPVRVS